MIKRRPSKKKGILVDKNIWFHDIEVFPNYSLFAFENKETEEIVTIEIHDRDNGDLAQFLSTKIDDKSIGLIGYNCLGYDGQVIEFILKNPGCTVEQIKSFNDEIFKSRDFPPYRVEKLSYSYLDLMLINNYGPRSAKSTSLKQLSFFFRNKSVRDSPSDFQKPLKDSEKEDVVKYCIKDIADTKAIYQVTIPLIELRARLGALEGLSLINSPEPKLAKQYFWNVIHKLTGDPLEDIKNRRTYRKEIAVKDIIFDYVKFTTKEFNQIKQF
jgi:hypothetical protein